MKLKKKTENRTLGYSRALAQQQVDNRYFWLLALGRSAHLIVQQASGPRQGKPLAFLSAEAAREWGDANGCRGCLLFWLPAAEALRRGVVVTI